MTFAVGVDGGGTAARAVIVDTHGRELARAESQGAVVQEAAPRAAAEAVANAVRAAAARAELALPAEALWAGLAGAGREPARRAVIRALEEHALARRLIVGTDVEAAFHAAFGEGAGILVVAGTGSVAWARDPGGVTVRAGGWGELLGDEGSGYAIGLGALRAVARAEDGRGPATSLRGAVLSALSAADVEALIPWAAAASKAEMARLAPLVVEAAARGDAMADGLLTEAARELEAHVVAVLARTGPWAAPPELVLWGGLLREGGALRGRVVARLAAHPVRVVERAPDPALGAARLALRSLA